MVQLIREAEADLAQPGVNSPVVELHAYASGFDFADALGTYVCEVYGDDHQPIPADRSAGEASSRQQPREYVSTSARRLLVVLSSAECVCVSVHVIGGTLMQWLALPVLAGDPVNWTSRV